MSLDASLLQRAAAAAAGHQQLPAGALYVVATPIGNLADISLRALHVLGQVDALACEDTRVGGALLRHFGLRERPLIAVHAHNEAEAAGAVLARLAAGERVAFVSDAGTPAVSDPGARLVRAAAEAGNPVVPLPGPSAVTTALAAAGDVRGNGWRFAGFLPSKGGERRDALAALAADRGTVVLFEAPHRVQTLAAELAAAMPGRAVTLARELTKQFETVVTQPAAALPAWLAADTNRLKGEFVCVLHAEPEPAAAEADALPPAAAHALAVLQAELPLKQAVALAAAISGAPRNAVYAAALARRDAAEG